MNGKDMVDGAQAAMRDTDACLVGMLELKHVSGLHVFGLLDFNQVSRLQPGFLGIR